METQQSNPAPDAPNQETPYVEVTVVSVFSQAECMEVKNKEGQIPTLHVYEVMPLDMSQCINVIELKYEDLFTKSEMK
jgi:hypothetical protein